MNKPLIFLGSNSNLALFAETAEQMGISVKGVIDDNYFGNTDSICYIPFIGSEKTFNFEKERDSYVFFVSPSVVPLNLNDRNKRQKMIKIVDDYNLELISLINKFSQISKSAILHPGCYVGFGAGVGYKSTLMPHSQVHSHSALSHDCILGKNSVVERRAYVIGGAIVGENVHIGFDSVIAKANIVGNNSVVHPRVTVFRDVEENEIVSLAGGNTRRIYGDVVKT
jgi:acetyltransferase-like isoleucine patch superfamily enzyme